MKVKRFKWHEDDLQDVEENNCAERPIVGRASRQQANRDQADREPEEESGQSYDCDPETGVSERGDRRKADDHRADGVEKRRARQTLQKILTQE